MSSPDHTAKPHPLCMMSHKHSAAARNCHRCKLLLSAQRMERERLAKMMPNVLVASDYTEAEYLRLFEPEAADGE